MLLYFYRGSRNYKAYSQSHASVCEILKYLLTNFLQCREYIYILMWNCFHNYFTLLSVIFESSSTFRAASTGFDNQLKHHSSQVPTLAASIKGPLALPRLAASLQQEESGPDDLIFLFIMVFPLAGSTRLWWRLRVGINSLQFFPTSLTS